MDKNIIENYINFGINNGYKGLEKYKNMSWEFHTFEGETTLIVDSDGFICEININILQIITSKEFIEAIARGLCKDFCVTENYDNIIKDKIKRIIIHQAKAIAKFEGDNLEEFINNLIL